MSELIVLVISEVSFSLLQSRICFEDEWSRSDLAHIAGLYFLRRRALFTHKPASDLQFKRTVKLIIYLLIGFIVSFCFLHFPFDSQKRKLELSRSFVVFRTDRVFSTFCFLLFTLNYMYHCRNSSYSFVNMIRLY